MIRDTRLPSTLHHSWAPRRRPRCARQGTRAARRLSLEEKLTGQKQVRALEATRSQKRRSLFEAQDQVDQKREELIAGIEEKLAQQWSATELFTIRWGL